jgi:hypothetical protein
MVMAADYYYLHCQFLSDLISGQKQEIIDFMAGMQCGWKKMYCDMLRWNPEDMSEAPEHLLTLALTIGEGYQIKKIGSFEKLSAAELVHKGIILTARGPAGYVPYFMDCPYPDIAVSVWPLFAAADEVCYEPERLRTFILGHYELLIEDRIEEFLHEAAKCLDSDADDVEG